MLNMSDYRCPITANCPITLSDFNFTEWLVKNEAANAPIGIEEFVMVMINPFLITYFFIFASNMLHFFSLSFQTLSVAMLKITYPVFCCLKRKPFQCQLQIDELLLPYEHIFSFASACQSIHSFKLIVKEKVHIKECNANTTYNNALFHCLVSILA